MLRTNKKDMIWPLDLIKLKCIFEKKRTLSFEKTVAADKRQNTLTSHREVLSYLYDICIFFLLHVKSACCQVVACHHTWQGLISHHRYNKKWWQIDYLYLSKLFDYLLSYMLDYSISAVANSINLMDDSTECVSQPI